MKENRIHVAYGFHVNCYHSYRGDSNDNLGFGSDIRIIRKTLDILTSFNRQGIPVKGTWDTENFFSLQKILPEYAPDIIEKMKERVEKYGDENIIMGYNNGALSAMTEDEFSQSISLAVTNKQGSGLQDIFGKCEMIVRPQEVMFTPSQVSSYNKVGVKALCLYYSCVPFDAFRTIIPQLDDEKAFNPLKYTYKGESLTIIPTYSNSDVCDAGCLRGWVKDLRRKQESGEINNDLFLFINMDADGMFWETLDLGPLTGKIANTDGIHGLVKEIADLPYIVFDTPSGYLKNHPCLGEISFTQDTADGNFTGYASWAEKPFNRKIWTRIEKARAMAGVTAERDMLSPSFHNRVLLLSTTHFGLATPVLNIQREKTALELSDAVINDEITAMPRSKKITLHNINGTAFQCLQVSLKEKLSDISRLKIKSVDLLGYTAVATDDKNSSAFIMMKFREVKKKYEIGITLDGEASTVPMTYSLDSGDLRIDFSPRGKITLVKAYGRVLSEGEFLQSFITYKNKKYSFLTKKACPLKIAGEGQGISIRGEIHLPGEITPGSFVYDFYKTPLCSGILVRATVKYPYTAEKTSISTENSSLGRYTDMNWTEAVPFQLTPCLKGDISVIKRNFAGDISHFRTQSFPECDSKNDYIASFNHQLTAGMVGLYDEEGGIIVANARQVLSSMAHCPMRLEKDKTVRMNPFGTYYGEQRHHNGRAKDQILNAYTLVAAQGKSIAPSYNGSSETAILGLFPLSSEGLTREKETEICAFSDGSVISCPDNAPVSAFNDDNITLHRSTADGISEKQLKSPVMTGIRGNLTRYLTKGTKAIAHILIQQLKAR